MMRRVPNSTLRSLMWPAVFATRVDNKARAFKDGFVWQAYVFG